MRGPPMAGRRMCPTVLPASGRIRCQHGDGPRELGAFGGEQHRHAQLVVEGRFPQHQRSHAPEHIRSRTTAAALIRDCCQGGGSNVSHEGLNALTIDAGEALHCAALQETGCPQAALAWARVGRLTLGLPALAGAVARAFTERGQRVVAALVVHGLRPILLHGLGRRAAARRAREAHRPRALAGLRRRAGALQLRRCARGLVHRALGGRENGLQTLHEDTVFLGEAAGTVEGGARRPGHNFLVQCEGIDRGGACDRAKAEHAVVDAGREDARRVGAILGQGRQGQGDDPDMPVEKETSKGD
mmetsp:Transcript_37027/g.73688  ORF Transcript_37027/g.73688 Transcript_37027/m.73688 type:complete len:301 (-) Transcript_37027:154-1056(-)